jgi:hypothetical protein
LQRGGTGPARSLSSGRLTTSISVEAERQRSVIAKSRSCKIAAALGSSFFPAWCIFLVTLREQDLLPVTQIGAHWQTAPTIFRSVPGGAPLMRQAAAEYFFLTFPLRTSRVAYPWLLASVGHCSLGAGGKHIDGLAEFVCRTLRVVRVRT